MFRVRELIEYGKTLDPMRFEKRLFIGGGEGNWGEAGEEGANREPSRGIKIN